LVTGSSGHDIQAVIAGEENYTNWITGHQAQAFWTTQDQQTTDNIEARLRPGMYHLAFSNKFRRLRKNRCCSTSI
jgi:hypothetical protein